jgi:hypothetical protein
VIFRDYEIFGGLMFMFAKLNIENKIVDHIHDEDGPYFALTKAENYVLKFKKGIY